MRAAAGRKAGKSMQSGQADFDLPDIPAAPVRPAAKHPPKACVASPKKPVAKRPPKSPAVASPKPPAAKAPPKSAKASSGPSEVAAVAKAPVAKRKSVRQTVESSIPPAPSEETLVKSTQSDIGELASGQRGERGRSKTPSGPPHKTQSSVTGAEHVSSADVVGAIGSASATGDSDVGPPQLGKGAKRVRSKTPSRQPQEALTGIIVAERVKLASDSASAGQHSDVGPPQRGKEAKRGRSKTPSGHSQAQTSTVGYVPAAPAESVASASAAGHSDGRPPESGKGAKRGRSRTPSKPPLEAHAGTTGEKAVDLPGTSVDEISAGQSHRTVSHLGEGGKPDRAVTPSRQPQRTHGSTSGSEGIESLGVCVGSASATRDLESGPPQPGLGANRGRSKTPSRRPEKRQTSIGEVEHAQSAGVTGAVGGASATGDSDVGPQPGKSAKCVRSKTPSRQPQEAQTGILGAEPVKLARDRASAGQHSDVGLSRSGKEVKREPSKAPSRQPLVAKAHTGAAAADVGRVSGGTRAVGDVTVPPGPASSGEARVRSRTPPRQSKSAAAVMDEEDDVCMEADVGRSTSSASSATHVSSAQPKRSEPPKRSPSTQPDVSVGIAHGVLVEQRSCLDLFFAIEEAYTLLHKRGVMNLTALLEALSTLQSSMSALIVHVDSGTFETEYATDGLDAIHTLCSSLVPFMHHPSLKARLQVCATQAVGMNMLSALQTCLPQAGGSQAAQQLASCEAVGPVAAVHTASDPEIKASASEPEEACLTAANRALLSDVFISALSLLGTTSAALRVAALRVIEQIPTWDPRVFGRAVKIPTFQKVDDSSENAEKGIDSVNASDNVGQIVWGQERERWEGALYFVLDDESAATRALALRVLQSAVCRPELRDLSRKQDDAGAKAMKGVFQRVAAVAATCLVDDDVSVRNAAADTLIDMMQRCGVSFAQVVARQRGDKKAADNLSVEYVLQALQVDQAVVYRVLRGARFVDSNALEAAILGLMYGHLASFRHRDAEDKTLFDLLSSIGKSQAHLLEAGEKGCSERLPYPKPCKGLGHLLFKDLADGTTLGSDVASVSRSQLLSVLLRAAAVQQPRLVTCIPTLASACTEEFSTVPDLRCTGRVAMEASLGAWVEQLGRCYTALCESVCPGDVSVHGGSSGSKSSTRPRRVGFSSGQYVRQELRGVQMACNRAIRLALTSSSGLLGKLHATVAWADLLQLVSQAYTFLGADTLVGSNGGACEEAEAPPHPDAPRPDPDALLAFGEQIHRATSRLMHCFHWSGLEPEAHFPQVLLAFRLLALRLLSDGSDMYTNDLTGACVALGATSDEAELIPTRPAHMFLPRLANEYFQSLLGPGASPIGAHAGTIHPVDGGGASKNATAKSTLPTSRGSRESVACVRFQASLGGTFIVEVDSTVEHGLWLHSRMPCVGPCGMEDLQTRVMVPPGSGDQRGAQAECMGRDKTRKCEVPVTFPCPIEESKGVNMSLQLVLSVDTCSKIRGDTGPACGGTLVACDRPLYARLNQLHLGDPVEVPFAATASAADNVTPTAPRASLRTTPWTPTHGKAVGRSRTSGGKGATTRGR